MAGHLPKGDLKTLDNLALYLQEIMSLPKDKKLIVDPKMKLIGSDIKRSLAELLQGPQNFLRGEIELPDMEDPKSIKSFLYKMQAQGRAGRDALNIFGGKSSSLMNQHHVAGLMELMPNYAGKTAEEAFDISKTIYEATGVWPGSHGGNLVEISGHKSIHLGAAHGGSYTGQKITGSPKDMLRQTFGSIKLNQERAALAQRLSEPLYDYARTMMQEGGLRATGKDLFYRNALGELTPEAAAEGRKAFAAGEKIVYPGAVTNMQRLKESGIEFNAGLGTGAYRQLKNTVKNQTVPSLLLNREAINQALDGNPVAAGLSAAAGTAIDKVTTPLMNKVIPEVVKRAPALVKMGGAMRLASPIGIGVAGGQILGDIAIRGGDALRESREAKTQEYADSFEPKYVGPSDGSTPELIKTKKKDWKDYLPDFGITEALGIN
tara:strand:- start:48 stop:1349 length:1302 start_codon:yes stop_codon:yes gene_type:complete